MESIRIVSATASRIEELVTGQQLDFTFLEDWSKIDSVIGTELIVVKTHCEFVECRESLKLELQNKMFRFNEKGLMIDISRIEPISVAVGASKRQQWNRASEIEAPWVQYLELATAIVSLLEHVSAVVEIIEGENFLYLQPGQEPFSRFTQLLSSVLSAKASFMPSSIIEYCGEVEAALKEHDTLLLFEALLHRYQVNKYFILLEILAL